eukprot:scaffold27990_cov19-Tisochrysis_lutea.AAC.1
MTYSPLCPVAGYCQVCCGALLCAPLLCILGVMWDSPLCPAAVCCQQLLALEPRMLCMRGPGGLGHTALHWAAAKDGAVCQGKVGRRLNHLMLHQGGGETGDGCQCSLAAHHLPGWGQKTEWCTCRWKVVLMESGRSTRLRMQT